jgi:Mce-associated membrane protein
VSVSLYDVLDVDPSASPEEIRAAWKAAIADLGPGDRRFRAYNEAAEVLLDPERRADYDAELSRAAAEGGPDLERESEPEAEPDAEAEPEPEPEPEPKPEPEPEPEPGMPESADAAAERTTVAPWLVAAAGVLAAAVLAVTIYVWVTFESGDAKVEATEGGVDEAVAAAEEAAVPVLSYDYRSLGEDIVEAGSYMTPGYAAKHNDLMNDLRGDIVAQKAIVDAQLQGSAVVRVGDDRADILVLVNHVTDKDGTEPFVIPVWVTLQMVNQDGEWLVDSVTNEGAVAG